MAKTYRDVAIDQMTATVEEATSHAIGLVGDPADTSHANRCACARQTTTRGFSAFFEVVGTRRP